MIDTDPLRPGELVGHELAPIARALERQDTDAESSGSLPETQEQRIARKRIVVRVSGHSGRDSSIRTGESGKWTKV